MFRLMVYLSTLATPTIGRRSQETPRLAVQDFSPHGVALRGVRGLGQG
jgi:hypothetical protein